MDESFIRGSQSAALRALLADAVAYLDAFPALAEGLSSPDLVAEARGVERLTRVLGAVFHPLIRVWGERRVPDLVGTKTVGQALQAVLTISPADAGARVRAAAALGTRRTITGEALQPQYPLAAAAAKAGDLSGEQTQVFLRTMLALPRFADPGVVEAAEKILIDAARVLPPPQLAGVGKQLIDTVDPDGTLAPESEQQRRRYVTLHQQPDGMVKLEGLLTAETGAAFTAVLNALAAPRTSTDEAGTTITDDRVWAQRAHDGLLDLANLGLRADQIVVGAPKVQLTISMTESAAVTGTGLARTGDGHYLSATDALALSDQATCTAVIHTATGGILDYGQRRRCASDGQRAAILSRDRGCSFPGCPAPPAWAEIHHIVAWQDGGPTNLDNLVGVCGFHHRSFERLGWSCEIRDTLPYWIPPALIDPDRTPRHNRHWFDERTLA